MTSLKTKLDREFIKKNTVIKERKFRNGKKSIFLEFIFKDKHLYRCFAEDREVYKSTNSNNLIHIATASEFIRFVDIVFNDITNS